MKERHGKPNVLFVLMQISSVSDMLYVAQGIAPVANPIFWIISPDFGLRLWRDSLEKRGYSVIYEPNVFTYGGRRKNEPSVGMTPRQFRSISLKRISNRLAPSASRLYWKWKGYRPFERAKELRLQINTIDALLSRLNPRAILLRFDVGGLRILSARARRFNIPTLIVPSATSSVTASRFFLTRGLTSFDAWQNRECRGVNASLLNRVIATLYPEITYRHSDQVYINSNSMQILVDKLFGVYPDNPWHLGGSKGSFLALGGVADWERYRSYGVDENRLVLTGEINHDELFQVLREKQAKPSQTQPLVLYGVSPFPEHSYLSWQEHLEIMRQVIHSLQQIPCTIRFCLHPNHDPHRYLELAQELNIAVEERPLIKALPEASAFLTWFSTTIPWAVILGVPVINLDIYDSIDIRSSSVQDFIDYSTLGGVVNVTTQQEMVDTLGRILFDEEYRQQLKALREQYVRENALLDGRCGERLVSVVLDMIEGRKPRLAGKLPVADEA